MPDVIPTKEQAASMLPPNFVGVLRNITGGDLPPTFRERQWASDAIMHPGTTIVGFADKSIGRCLEVKDAKGTVFIQVKE